MEGWRRSVAEWYLVGNSTGFAPVTGWCLVEKSTGFSLGVYRGQFFREFFWGSLSIYYLCDQQTYLELNALTLCLPLTPQIDVVLLIVIS